MRTLEGRVVGVADGDTLTLLMGRHEFRIRLAQIDAPEQSQPWGRRAKRALSELTYGKQARVVVVDVDRYERAVGEVYVDGVHVNREMVRRGHAWAYTRYASSVDILDDESEARDAGRGLWSLPPAEREAPWEWRHGRDGGASGDSCPARRRCGEMTSCAQVRDQVHRCGIEGLDGDGDGVPCESLCGR